MVLLLYEMYSNGSKFPFPSVKVLVDVAALVPLGQYNKPLSIEHSVSAIHAFEPLVTN
jgi:hypothetical protein